LGCLVSLDGGANEDVTNRINKAKGAFAQLGLHIRFIREQKLEYLKVTL
jgi:hypothetical protein